MKKIITAISNPKLNDKLKKEKNFEVIGKDILYKEAILEILEGNKEIDLVIVSEDILGEMKWEELIQKIKQIKEEIKIIFILEKENHDLEKILIKNNILDIYYNNKINLEELIKIINKKEKNIEEEIIKLKKIIEERNNYFIEKEKNKNKRKKIGKEKRKKTKNEKQKIRKKKEESRNMLTKIISFSGNCKSGKTSLSLIISQCLAEKNYKTLLIDADLEKKDLTTILKREIERQEKRKNKIYNGIKKLNKKRKLKQMKSKKRKIKWINKNGNSDFEIIKNIVEKYTKKINYNYYFFPALKKIIKNNRQKSLYYFFKSIKENYDFIIIDLAKNNYQEVNQQILKNCYINFIVLEANLLGMKELHRLLEKYIKGWKINVSSLHIVKNKKNFISINRKLISKYFSFKNKIFEIKENKFYSLFMNHYYKRKILLKNRIIKKELNKILNKIIFN